MAGFIDLSGTNLIIKSSNTTANILCSQTFTTILQKCKVNSGIGVYNQIAYTSNMIGYTNTINSNYIYNIAANSSTIASLTDFQTTIPRGVYIINMKVGLLCPTSGTNINFLSAGLSTSSNSYISGTGVWTLLSESILTSAASQSIYGMDCRPVDLSGNNYYFVVNASTNQPVSTTTYSGYSYTRIA